MTRIGLGAADLPKKKCVCWGGTHFSGSLLFPQVNGYPLVNKHSYWTWPFIYSWFTYQTWWFPIVMLVYQRVKSVRGWNMSHFDHFGGFKRQPKIVEAGDSAVLILKCDSHYHLRYCRTPPRQIEQVQFTFFFFQLPSFFWTLLCMEMEVS